MQMKIQSNDHIPFFLPSTTLLGERLVFIERLDETITNTCERTNMIRVALTYINIKHLYHYCTTIYWCTQIGHMKRTQKACPHPASHLDAGRLVILLEGAIPGRLIWHPSASLGGGGGGVWIIDPATTALLPNRDKNASLRVRAPILVGFSLDHVVWHYTWIECFVLKILVIWGDVCKPPQG